MLVKWLNFFGHGTYRSLNVKSLENIQLKDKKTPQIWSINWKKLNLFFTIGSKSPKIKDTSERVRKNLWNVQTKAIMIKLIKNVGSIVWPLFSKNQAKVKQMAKLKEKVQIKAPKDPKRPPKMIN